MKIAHIVPLRRVQNVAPWFDYLVPDGLDVAIGQLVTIPFRQQQIKGLVWDLADTSTIVKLQPVLAVIVSTPVLTAGQRKICEIISQQYFVPLSQVLLSVIPTFPTRVVRSSSKKLPTPFSLSRNTSAQTPSATETFWYRDRREAQTWLAEWLRNSERPKLLLVPTVADGDELQAWLETQGIRLPFISSQLTPAHYRRIYGEVLDSEITAVIATSRGLLLPWPATPEIAIDQEDHPAYKQLAQHPRLDPRPLAELLSDTVIATTPAPTVSWFGRHHPIPPPVTTDTRQLISLDRPNHRPWLSDEAAQLADELRDQDHLLWIVPQRGYAQVIRCRDCGQTVECPNCHERAQLRERPSKKVLCQHCDHLFQLPTVCPNCHGLNWRPVGLGTEYFAELLKQSWPNHRISTSWPPLEGAQHWIGTTGAYQWLQHHPVKATIVVSGDSLLNWPDFSAAERAWQFLARLQASQPTTPLLVQTFHPESAFWQRWRHGDDQRWYEEELKERKVLRLPPTVDQWLLHYRGPDVAKEQQRIEAALKKINLAGLSWRSLGQRPQELHLLLTAPLGSLSQLPDPLAIWPWPWQIDPQVTTWLR